jgi:hypothetical protein
MAGVFRRRALYVDDSLTLPERIRILTNALVRPSEERGDVGDLRDARAVVWEACRGLQRSERLMLQHAWSLAQNDSVTESMSYHVAVSYLPSSREGAFSPHTLLNRLAIDRGTTPAKLLEADDVQLSLLLSRAGYCVANVNECRVITMTYQHYRGRRWWRQDGFSCWVDSAGRLRMGGVEPGEHDNENHHHVWWSDFARDPYKPKFSVDKHYVARDEGHDLLFGLEKAAVSREGVSLGLNVPRLWLGFGADESDHQERYDLDGETPTLRGDILRLVRTWVELKYPRNLHPATDMLNGCAGVDGLTPTTSWREMVQALGPLVIDWVLQAFWDEAALKFDGLFWLPADYFPPAGRHRPWERGKHLRKLLAFDAAAMGREMADGSVDPFRSRVQVIPMRNSSSYTQRRERLVGTSDGCSWYLMHGRPNDTTRVA